ncbi:MAG: ester cyclase [Gaiellaceae bacterium]
MSNADTMRQFYDRLNAGDVDGFAALIADDLIEHEEVEGLPQTKEGVIQFFEMFRAAFSDLRMEAEDVIESGDKAWARIRITGTNDGEFMGMPATGKSVDFQAVDIVRVNDEGVAAEHWGVTDTMKMMQQLGVVPEGPPA